MSDTIVETQKDIQAHEQEVKAWPKVAIIILNWNGWRDTIESLESVQRLAPEAGPLPAAAGAGISGSRIQLSEGCRRRGCDETRGLVMEGAIYASTKTRA